MKMKFTKMHGAGNDFVMVDDRDGSFPCDGRRIAAIAARRIGVGCEGVILVGKSSRADFSMRFFNPDGSEAELCGNGARCVAAFAREIGAAKGKVMCFETAAGLVDAEILDESQVKVWMPDPKGLDGDFVNSGVPHFIVPVESLAKADVDGEGRRIRLSERFAPHGTNVDFVVYRPPHRVSVRTYERGVEAETGACGTGAVAAAVVGVETKGLSLPIRVRCSQGCELTVDGDWRRAKSTGFVLTGPVKRVFEGEIDLDALEVENN